MSRTITYFHVYIILDFSITSRNASVCCQSEWACLHKTVNLVVFFVKRHENTYPKGRALKRNEGNRYVVILPHSSYEQRYEKTTHITTFSNFYEFAVLN